MIANQDFTKTGMGGVHQGVGLCLTNRVGKGVFYRLDTVVQ